MDSTNKIRMKSQIINNTERKHYEMEVDGETAYIEYGYYKDIIALVYIFVPEMARGKGISSALMQFALEDIKQQNKKIIVYCPFIAKYIRLHPEYEPLLDKEYLR
jgi:predicted GNAT family acetyltransferase